MANEPNIPPPAKAKVAPIAIPAAPQVNKVATVAAANTATTAKALRIFVPVLVFSQD